jgi:hypothetical protein
MPVSSIACSIRARSTRIMFDANGFSLLWSLGGPRPTRGTTCGPGITTCPIAVRRRRGRRQQGRCPDTERRAGNTGPRARRSASKRVEPRPHRKRRGAIRLPVRRRRAQRPHPSWPTVAPIAGATRKVVQPLVRVRPGGRRVDTEGQHVGSPGELPRQRPGRGRGRGVEHRHTRRQTHGQHVEARLHHQRVCRPGLPGRSLPARQRGQSRPPGRRPAISSAAATAISSENSDFLRPGSPENIPCVNGRHFRAGAAPSCRARCHHADEPLGASCASKVTASSAISVRRGDPPRECGNLEPPPPVQHDAHAHRGSDHDHGREKSRLGSKVLSVASSSLVARSELAVPWCLAITRPPPATTGSPPGPGAPPQSAGVPQCAAVCQHSVFVRCAVCQCA